MKTEYKEQERSQSTPSRSPSYPLTPGSDRGRRDSYGVYREREAARKQYLRSQSEDVYTIPRTDQTMITLTNNSADTRGYTGGGGYTGGPGAGGYTGAPGAGGYTGGAGGYTGGAPGGGGYLGPVRGAQHPHPEELWSRQTSMETSYNVPSIRTDMGDQHGSLEAARGQGGSRQYGRFDSIAEVSENRSETGWRNNGYDL